MSDNELPKLPGPTKLHTVLPDDYRYGHIYGFTIGQMREYGRACERAAYKRATDACFEQNDDMASRDYNSAIDDCAVAPQAEPKREPACLWSRADDDTDTWETACRHAFTIIEGTPSDNHMEFCCYCGRPLEQEIGGSDAE